MGKIAMGIVFLFGLFNVMGQDLSAYKKEVFVKGKDRMPYRILLPDNYNPEERYPLLLFLHGSGERGTDNELQLVHGARLFLQEDVRKKFPAIVVFPQCPKEDQWSNKENTADPTQGKFIFHKKGKPTMAMKMVQKLMKQLFKNYPVDRSKVYVGGLSMGGMGTFEIVRRNPKTFAAAFPICGGAHPDTAGKLTGASWWVFHGDKDQAVPYTYSSAMVKAIEAAKGKVKYSLYPDVGHNSWDNAFAEPQLLPWLFSTRR
ncbi:carboxylesterase family protein [Spongiimicrobium salis]|uniref:carboxylesterase family protein n=1 Tax=Spongiimicrobium salis TaxID=1667022 RepID=UPI00374D2C91